VVETRWGTTNDRKTQIDAKEGNVVSGIRRIIHYELLPPGKTIDATNQQLMRLIQEKRPKLNKKRTLIIERMLSFIMTTPDYTLLWRLDKNWESLVGKFWYIHHTILTLHRQTLHYYLFWFLQNSLNGVNLISKETCKNFFFLSRNLSSTPNNGIMALCKKKAGHRSKQHILGLTFSFLMPTIDNILCQL